MGPRPVIFVSAVSRELKSARDIVAKHLLQLGYEPVWQDLFGTEQGDVHQMLREKIEPCVGVLQLLGHRYGFEGPAPDPHFGRISYTQFEPLYGKLRGKKVWYLLLDATFPTDPAEPEPSALAELQRAYRERVQADSQLYHPIATVDGLRAAVLGMRDDLAALRRGWKVWAYAVAALLIVSVGIGAWLMHSSVRTYESTARINVRIDRMDAKEDQMLAALRGLSQAVAQPPRSGVPEDEATRLAHAYTALEEKLQLPPGTLAQELPGFAKNLLSKPGTSPLDQANALFALKDFAGAEKAALQARDRALASASPSLHDAIKALEVAANSAVLQLQFPRALEHLRAAAAFTSRERDLREWARVQSNLGELLEVAGRSAEAETLLRALLAGLQPTFAPDSPEVLIARNDLSVTLYSLGKYPAAEQEGRAILALRQRLLGPEHIDTLYSRINLANTLLAQGKTQEAEQEYRAVLPLFSRLRGSDDWTTLSARMNLALANSALGQVAAAEQETRAVLAARQRVLGPDHPETLATRLNLANALARQNKNQPAEQEYRAVQSAMARVLGPDHPSTLLAQGNLASLLDSEGQYPLAEKLLRETLASDQRILGADHPDTARIGYSLALTLYDEKRYADCEQQHRQVLASRERNLGATHPDVLWSCTKLGWCLLEEGKTKEASQFAQRALAGFKAQAGEKSDGYQNALGLQAQLKAKAK